MERNDCWLWAGHVRSDGYGGIWNTLKNQYDVAHRLVYESLVGTVPKGLQLDHLCRVRHCINPYHLEPVTMKENILRGEGAGAKNARKTHCKNNHLLGGDNLKIATDGSRQCKMCKPSYYREYYQRNLEKRRKYAREWQRSKRELNKVGGKK